MKLVAQQQLFRQLFYFQKGEAGFTLIELLVVVIIAGVLAAIGIPAWQGMRLKTQAAGAKTVIANIKKECESNRDLGVDEIFTPMTPSGYSLQPRGSLSCYGDPGTGLVSAVPNEDDKNPTYFYEHLTGLISEESVEAKNLPPNESIAFGPDSGLSCREVKAYDFGFSGGYSYITRSGQYVSLTPKIISVGDKSWVVRAGSIVLAPWQSSPSGWPPVYRNDYVKKFANSAVNVINNSEGEFSAEIDPSNPTSIKVYSPKGTLQNDFSIRSIPRPPGSIHASASVGIGIGDQSNGQTTTVCDGR